MKGSAAHWRSAMLFGRAGLAYAYAQLHTDTMARPARIALT